MRKMHLFPPQKQLGGALGMQRTDLVPRVAFQPPNRGSFVHILCLVQQPTTGVVSRSKQGLPLECPKKRCTESSTHVQGARKLAGLPRDTGCLNPSFHHGVRVHERAAGDFTQSLQKPHNRSQEKCHGHVHSQSHTTLVHYLNHVLNTGSCVRPASREGQGAAQHPHFEYTSDGTMHHIAYMPLCLLKLQGPRTT